MRVLDSVTTDHLHKLMLIEEGGRYAILPQSAGRAPQKANFQSFQEVIAEWKQKVFQMFFATTRNQRDSELLTDRRMLTLS